MSATLRWMAFTAQDVCRSTTAKAFTLAGWVGAGCVMAGCVMAGCGFEGAEGPDGTPGATGDPPNILLVSLDTLRADRVGVYGGPPGRTPNMDRFADEAVVIDQVFAQANETLFSHASLFTSRYASELGVVDYAFDFPEEVPTLAEILGLYGYDTAGFVAGGHLAPVFGLGDGFDTYESIREWASLYHTTPAGLRWLDDRTSERPFFLFLHSYDCHNRYLKPHPYGRAWVDPEHDGVGGEIARRVRGSLLVRDGWYYPTGRPDQILDFEVPRIRSAEERARLTAAAEARGMKAIPVGEADQAYMRDIYDGAVSYADAMLGLLMADLERRSLLDNTLVVLISDHGEELGEDGMFNHRYALSDAALRVPWMIRLPGGERGGSRVMGLFELTDLLPTLLSAAGATPPAHVRGNDLWAAIQEGTPAPSHDVAASEGAFRMISVRDAGGRRLNLTGIGADSPVLDEMLTLAQMDGPAFQRSPGLSVDEARHLRKAMTDWRQSIIRPPLRLHRLTESQREALRRDGYWGPQ